MGMNNMKYIYLTSILYLNLIKVSDDGFFSVYGIQYDDGYIIPYDILDMTLYNWVYDYLKDLPIIEPIFDTGEIE